LAADQRKNIADIPDSCPHCGKELSPWQKVLLSVDRALMCKNCWYRIVLEVFQTEKEKRTMTTKNDSEKQNKASGSE
jgi:DNA-directed RNA polymerase subunit RPC12/RpoP